MFLAIITTEVQSTSALQRLDENNEFMATLQEIRLCFSGVPQSRVQIIASRSTSDQHMLFTGKPYITLFQFLPHRIKSVVPRHCVNAGTDNETTWSSPFLSRANQHQVDIHFWILSVNIDLLSLGIPSVACQKTDCLPLHSQTARNVKRTLRYLKTARNTKTVYFSWPKEMTLVATCTCEYEWIFSSK